MKYKVGDILFYKGDEFTKPGIFEIESVDIYNEEYEMYINDAGGFYDIDTIDKYYNKATKAQIVLYGYKGQIQN